MSRERIPEPSWLIYADNTGAEVQVGHDPAGDGYTEKYWKAFLSFDMTGVTVGLIESAKLFLRFKGNTVFDAPLKQHSLAILYGEDQWGALALSDWALASTIWPGNQEGAWRPLWSEFGALDVNEWAELAVSDLAPLSGFTGTLLQVKVESYGTDSTYGQYSAFGSGNASKSEPYLELTLSEASAASTIISVDEEDRTAGVPAADRTASPCVEDRAALAGEEGREGAVAADDRTVLVPAESRTGAT